MKNNILSFGNNFSMKKMAAILLGTFLVFSLIGSGGLNSEPVKAQNPDIKLGYVNWAGTVAETFTAKAALEKKLGLNVKTIMVDVGPVYTGLAEGDIDAFMGAWLPRTHKSYVEKFDDDIIKAGPNFLGAKIGLVVPEYVPIDSIKELNKHADKFDNKIVGIDSGAGIMKATRKALKNYNLDLNLIASSGPAMTAALKKAIENKEWVVVTGWKPHWKFARWDLKFLKDPDTIYGGEENIYSFTKTKLTQEHPIVANFLHDFRLSSQQLGQIMNWIENGTEPEKAGERWVEENEDIVEGWLNPAKVSE